MKKSVFLLLFISFSFILPSENQFYIVSAKSGLVLRSGPGVKYKKITIIPDGKPVIILKYAQKQETINNITADWVKVKYKNNIGWVFSGYLQPDSNELIFRIEKKTIILYYPKIVESDYEKEEGLNEVVSDYNYYTHALLEYAETLGTDIQHCVQCDVILLKNSSKTKEITVPNSEHTFGYIYVSPELKTKLLPGIYTFELIDYFNEFFKIPESPKPPVDR